MELIRELHKFFEDKGDDKPVEVPPINGRTDSEIKYHLVLMDQAGLLRCERMRSKTDPERIIRVLPFSLTWQGHEFLDAARNDTVWNNVMKDVKSRGLSVTLSVLQSLLVSAIKGSFGL